jgi:hypothetical protein
VQTTSYQAEPGLRDGRLTLVLRAFECAPTPVSLVYARQRLLPLKVRAFIDYAMPRLVDRLQSIAATLRGLALSSSASEDPNACHPRKARKPR